MNEQEQDTTAYEPTDEEVLEAAAAYAISYPHNDHEMEPMDAHAEAMRAALIAAAESRKANQP